MEQFETEGIVIHTTPYQETSLIGHLFTPGGIFSFLTHRKKTQQSPLSPLNLGTFLLEKKLHASLYKVKEFKISNSFLELRKSYSHLKAAGSILQHIKTTQLSEKPSPLLFNLTKTYLSKLKTFKLPQILELSFMIKLLNHEGMLSHELCCNSCQNAVFNHIEGGHYFCNLCAPRYAINFSDEELHNFLILGFSRSIAELEKLSITKEFEEKIKGLYKQMA